MINIKLKSENGKTEGTMCVHGDRDALVNEIFAILVSLSEKVPELFDAAVEMHLKFLSEGKE